MDALMRRAAMVLILAAPLTLGSAAAQQPTDRLRVVRADPGAERVRVVRATPIDSVAFGTPFQLEVLLEVAPGTAVLLPDTLDAAASMASLAPGEWSGEVSGDTARVRLVYPVIAYRNGIEALPSLSLGIVSSEGASERWMPLRTVTGGLDADLSMVTLPLGSTTVPQHPAFDDEQEVVEFVPRPPADVAGGEWSVWLILAVGLATMAGVGGIGGFIPRWWSDSGAGLFSRMRGEDPRAVALAELDRLRGEGLHRDGRVQDFYVGVTDTLRAYLAKTRPQMDRSRTMTELGRTLQGSPAPVDRQLLDALGTAERVKFGLSRPDAVTAEADWRAIREWVGAQEDA